MRVRIESRDITAVVMVAQHCVSRAICVRDGGKFENRTARIFHAADLQMMRLGQGKKHKCTKRYVVLH